MPVIVQIPFNLLNANDLVLKHCNNLESPLFILSLIHNHKGMRKLPKFERSMDVHLYKVSGSN